MARKIKELVLAELEGRFSNLMQTGCVLIGYQGLKADEAMQVRRAFGEMGAEMTVVKNSMFALAVQHLGADGLTEMIRSGTAVVCAENPVQAAKAVKTITESYEAVQVHGAYAEGNVMGPDAVRKLAEIPSREVLLAMVAGAVMVPLRRLAGGLLAKPRALLNGLQQLREKTEQDSKLSADPDTSGQPASCVIENVQQ